jgi:ATP-dependent DNA helicase DinG
VAQYGRRECFLQATPIDVSPILKSYLFDRLECAVLILRLLPLGAVLNTYASGIGLDYVRESVLPSHFDYQNQSMLYVPPDLPDPRTPQFMSAKRLNASAKFWKSHAGVRLCSLRVMRK